VGGDFSGGGRELDRGAGSFDIGERGGGMCHNTILEDRPEGKGDGFFWEGEKWGTGTPMGIEGKGGSLEKRLKLGEAIQGVRRGKG